MILENEYSIYLRVISYPDHHLNTDLIIQVYEFILGIKFKIVI